MKTITTEVKLLEIGDHVRSPRGKAVVMAAVTLIDPDFGFIGQTVTIKHKSGRVEDQVWNYEHAVLIPISEAEYLDNMRSGK